MDLREIAADNFIDDLVVSHLDKVSPNMDFDSYEKIRVALKKIQLKKKIGRHSESPSLPKLPSLMDLSVGLELKNSFTN